MTEESQPRMLRTGGVAAAIARANKAEATIAIAKERGFIDDKGEVRDVLGQFNVTADGAIVNHHPRDLYEPRSGQIAAWTEYQRTSWAPIDYTRVYTTRAAAEHSTRPATGGEVASNG